MEHDFISRVGAKERRRVWWITRWVQYIYDYESLGSGDELWWYWARVCGETRKNSTSSNTRMEHMHSLQRDKQEEEEEEESAPGRLGVVPT